MKQAQGWGLHEPAAVASVLFRTGTSSRKLGDEYSRQGWGETLLFSPAGCVRGQGYGPLLARLCRTVMTRPGSLTQPVLSDATRAFLRILVT